MAPEFRRQAKAFLFFCKMSEEVTPSPGLILEIFRILKVENVKLKQHLSNSEICTTSKRCSQAAVAKLPIFLEKTLVLPRKDLSQP